MREPNAEILLALLLDTLIAGAPDGADELRSQSQSQARPRLELREEILASIDIGTGNDAPLHGFRRRFSRLFKVGEREAEAILARIGKPAGWEQLGTLLVHHFEPGPALAGAGAHAGLVRCQAGRPFPTHRHLGAETTFFLAGTVRDDETGELFLPGDIVSKPAESMHRLTVLPPQECIFAVLIEGEMPDFSPALLD